MEPPPDDARTTLRRHPSSGRRGIPAEEWQLCSKIFTEGRRIRGLAGELRTIVGGEASTPAARHALERYLRALDEAAALGDIAADVVVTHRSD